MKVLNKKWQSQIMHCVISNSAGKRYVSFYTLDLLYTVTSYLTCYKTIQNAKPSELLAIDFMVSHLIERIYSQYW